MPRRKSNSSPYDLWRNPLSFNYWNMTPERAKAFFDEFERRIPERVQALTHNVRLTQAFSSWEPDYSRASLVRLGEWFRTVGELCPVDPSETILPVDDPSLDKSTISGFLEAERRKCSTVLSEDTHALSLDAAIYLGESVRHVYPSLRWGLCKAQGNTNANYPLLQTWTNQGYNPIEIAGNIVKQTIEEEPLRYARFFDFWIEYAKLREADRQARAAKRGGKAQEGRDAQEPS